MNFKKKFIISSLIIVFLSFFLFGCPVLPVVNTSSQWLVLVYLDGDNNLEDAAIDDFNEMESAIYKLSADAQKKINVLVLFDAFDYFSGTRLYHVTADNDSSSIKSVLLKSYSELNMGDPQNLTNFVSYAKTNYTYENLMLVLWNHGGGARTKSEVSSSIDGLTKAVCWDDTNGEDCLYLDELQQSLIQNFNSSNKLDIIGFDACLMATVEVAYEFRDLASYMVASMHTEQGDGWDYEKLLYGGSTNCPVLDSAGYDNLTAQDFAIRAVKAYRDYIEEDYYYINSAETLSAVDLNKVGDIKTSMDNLAAILKDYQVTFESIRDNAIHFWETDEDSISTPYTDIYDLMDIIITGFSGINSVTTEAQNVKVALESAVLYAYGDYGETGGVAQTDYFGDGATVGHGLSAFVTRGDKLYNDSNSHYVYQWWYTVLDTNAWWTGGHYYGFIDFAYSDNDGSVEYWRELFEYWYDNLTNYTPGSY